MKLSEILAKLQELGHPEVFVGCFKHPEHDRHVQIRARVKPSSFGFEWTWFGFPNEGDPDMSPFEVCLLYELAAQSDEWYLDEIEIDPSDLES